MSAPLGTENFHGFTGPLRFFTLHYTRVCRSLICTCILSFLKVIFYVYLGILPLYRIIKTK